ncbi:MAG: cell division protein FtsA, partial [Lachnospiraceae bacterium]|nr:cell division protein FtsA [Lachnospiraceae bacterium]
DISVTKDGSIIAYGMIPHAGDELTELIVQNYLVDFNTAEKMKLESTINEEITYEDIMCLSNTIPAKDVWDLLHPTVENITKEIAEKIRELNGGKSVSACFVVGGGGKVHGFTESLAQHLGLIKERVALRGEEVLRQVSFIVDDVKKDPLLVTPIGICLNYYEQKNNFIMVRFNGERLKLYDNNHLTIVDAALAAEFPNEQIFPKRGKPINFMVNGVARIIRGEAGEAAVVTMNGEPANINTPLEPNCEIIIKPSTCGEDAMYLISMLEEYNQSTVTFIVNGKLITCPKFVTVNGKLAHGSYAIQENDQIETRSFYTVRQLAEFMDVEIDTDYAIRVNNREADFDTLVYENFSIEWTVVSYATAKEDRRKVQKENTIHDEGNALQKTSWKDMHDDMDEQEVQEASSYQKNNHLTKRPESVIVTEHISANAKQMSDKEGTKMVVYVNKEPVALTGKDAYIFVDVFDYITFDLNAGKGRAIVTLINGRTAQFTEPLSHGDKIELYWKAN